MHFSEILIELRTSRSSLLIESKENCIDPSGLLVFRPSSPGATASVGPLLRVNSSQTSRYVSIKDQTSSEIKPLILSIQAAPSSGSSRTIGMRAES